MKKIGKALSYILVGVCASLLTMFVMRLPGPGRGLSKLDQLTNLIDTYFVDEVEMEDLKDAAARSMIAATGDRWSYYISAEDYASYLEQSQNAYVGIGITIRDRQDAAGLDIVSVAAGGPAEAAGILPGDILTAVEGQALADIGLKEGKKLVRGKEGTSVSLTVLRENAAMDFTVTRRRFETPVATYEMLDSGYGLIRIQNFESRCADETIAAIEALESQGAKGLIFDVRCNPGGYKTELVKVLDHLLPEGPLFRSVDYRGREELDESDDRCVELPMAVLVNGDTYSAAEFFAAALQEYDWAVIVGQPTCGKGHFQSTFRMSDGSAVALSIGNYFTPQGKSLTDVGVQPDVEIEVDPEINSAIMSGTLEKNEDLQLQAAISALNSAD